MQQGRGRNMILKLFIDKKIRLLYV